MNTTIDELLQNLADSVQGFTIAAERVGDAGLHTLLSSFAAERQEMEDELVAFSEVQAEERPTVTGELTGGWQGLEEAISQADDQAILEACEKTEEQAAELFSQATVANLSTEATSTISSIATRIAAVHKQVQGLRDEVAAGE